MESLNSNTISLRKLHFDDVDEWLSFGWHYSPERFKRAFSNVGILVEDDKDVIALSELAKKGGDVRGDLKSSDGKSINFSVLDIVKSIDDDADELNNKFSPTKGYMLMKVNKRLGIS